MSTQQTKSIAFGVAVAVLSLASIDVAVAASKFGMTALATGLHAEEKDSGIRVTSELMPPAVVPSLASG